MRRLILSMSKNQGQSVTTFRLRDGLLPIEDGAAIDGFTVSSAVRGNYSVSPDGQKVVVTNGGSGGTNFQYSVTPPTEASAFADGKVTAASFSGSISTTDASDSHFAVGGSSPFLYVFNWNGDLQSLDTSGIGTVRVVKFSPGGDYLAVHHTSSPYVRIYDTADWSYVNAAAGLSVPSGVGNDLFFVGDGRLVVGATSSPYLFTLNMETGERLSSHTSNTLVNSVSGIIKHPDQNAIIWVGSSGSSSNKHIGMMDLDTYQLSNPFEDIGAAIYTAVFDGVNRELIFIHNEAHGRNASIIQIDNPTTIISAGVDINSQLSGTIQANLVLMERDTGRISGTVRDIDNNPAERQVVALNRDGLYVAASCMSEPLTGNYELIVENTSLHDVQFRAEEGELLNDLFFARVEPEAV